MTTDPANEHEPSLSELFARDPLLHSEQDIVRIVARQREAQAQFDLGLKAPTAPKAPKAPKAPGAKGLDLLKDLGLG